MNTWNAFLVVVFLIYIGVEFYFWRKLRRKDKESDDGRDKS